MKAPTPAPPESETGHPVPRSASDLFVSFSLLALQGFGGVLAVVQRVIVEEKRWMTNDEFVEEWAVAQIMPGPNVMNLSIMIGDRYFGWRGAAAAVAGLLALPSMLVLLAAVLYSHYSNHPAVAGALHGMGAVAAGIIAATALKLAATLKKYPVGWRMAVLLSGVCFALVALLHWPLSWVIPPLGLLACTLTWRKIKP
jgi:chromate transporter